MRARSNMWRESLSWTSDEEVTEAGVRPNGEGGGRVVVVPGLCSVSGEVALVAAVEDSSPGGDFERRWPETAAGAGRSAGLLFGALRGTVEHWI